jgi:hypothetical protein
MFQVLLSTGTPADVVTPLQLNTPGYFNGCVLTMLDGAAANKSTRIVGWAYGEPFNDDGDGVWTSGELFYDANNNGTRDADIYIIRVMAFDGIDPTAAIEGRFIVNGRPFNGTGFGFNTNTSVDIANDPTLLSATELLTVPSGPGVTMPYALLPNPVHADPDARRPLKYLSIGNDGGSTYREFGGLGGADEDYDAGDAQNMLLAHLPLHPTGFGDIIPSLHRPDTVAWLTRDGGEYHTAFIASPPNPANYDAKKLADRQMVLRPLPGDHPQFPPVNSAGNLIIGPFDVDNDGDGIAESIWVDVGFPVRTLPDGRAVKPLAAIHCIDLDSRLNVNAHGSIAHVDNYHLSGTAQTDYATLIPPVCFGGSMPGLARGQGYGPAEISLYPLYTTSPTAPASVLPGYANLLAARYGEPNDDLFDLGRHAMSFTMYPYTTDPAATGPTSGQKLAPRAGITGWNDPLSDLRFSEYANAAATPSAFGSPHNLGGRGFAALDVRGTPMTPYMGNVPEIEDEAYELDLSRRAARASATSAVTPAALGIGNAATPNPHDSPFTVGELERVLRMYDLDAGELPDRLRVILETGATLPEVRSMITTDSFDLPSPNVLATRAQRLAAGAANPLIAQNISDMLRLRLIDGMSLTPPLTAAQEQQINNHIKRLLPWELAAGQRMDINRPFGNGRDDDADGVVDEADEFLIPTTYWDSTRYPSPQFDDFGTAPTKANNGIDMDGDGNGFGPVDKALARQLYARHLYVLMMLLTDPLVGIDFDQNGTVDAGETERGLAQWAINVVDFRDRDSIMTPFEFSVNPFANGWTADGDLSTPEPDSAVVWGCERPELLITETLAFHDRRTEDLAVDSSNMAMHVIGDPTNPDANYDQRLRPRGSLFIEVYNPWNTETSTRTDGFPSVTESPGEFYNIPSGTANGLRLNATAPGNSPVWRFIIVEGASRLADPDDPYAATPFQVADVDRAIYFADPAAIGDLPLTTLNYYTTLAVAPLVPGRYAVIGPAGQAGLNAPPVYVNTVGRIKVGAMDGSAIDTRSIQLMPGDPSPAVPNTNQVEIVNNNAPMPYEQPNAADMKPAVAAVMDAAVMNGTTYDYPNFSMSLSEPKSGYPMVTWDQLAAGGEGAYGPPIDTPFDNATFPANGTTENYRVIHLQRLANPTAAWNATGNPYLTIDTMTVDLTVFNGVEDPATAADTEIANNFTSVASYQRGDPAVLVPASPNLWMHQPPNPAAPAPLAAAAGGVQHIVDVALQHSLGYLNQGYGVTENDTAYKNLAAPAGEQAPLAAYIGSPKLQGNAGGNPFPWLTWNNRPFVGPMELLLVPKSRSSRLLIDYAALPTSLYDNATPTLGHLLNFFQIPASPPRNPSPAIFEYLHVPSRFAGTHTELVPGNFITSLPDLLTEEGLMSFYHPPFSRVSNYRDPGRVNINTIPSDLPDNVSSRIWNGIINATPGAATPPNWQTVFASRQGAAAWDPTTSSTRFGNPFRSAAGEALLLPDAANIGNREPIDVTLMRPLLPDTNNPGGDTPLFDYASVAGTADDSARNPAFRIQNLQRVSNLLTTRSNVYAIWITVGYFEVYPAPQILAVPPSWPGALAGEPSATYPDGYQLGPEVGSDTGEVVRHRAFYIYDRTIPVAFEPGVDHNFEDGLLLKRFIE